MVERPEPAPWTRRGFLKSAAVADGLAAGASGSHSVSISFALIGVVVGEFIGGESGGGLGYLIIQSLGTLNAADMMVALLVLGVIGIVMALGIKQVEARLLRWRPEYLKRAPLVSARSRRSALPRRCRRRYRCRGP